MEAAERKARRAEWTVRVFDSPEASDRAAAALRAAMTPLERLALLTDLSTPHNAAESRLPRSDLVVHVEQR